MKLLLDEGIDRRLAKSLAGYEVKTVPQMCWAGITNRRLFALAERQFDVFITVDRNLPAHQDLPQYRSCIPFCRYQQADRPRALGTGIDYRSRLY